MNLKTLQLIRKLTDLPVKHLSGNRLTVGGKEMTAVELLSDHSPTLLDLRQLNELGFVEEGELAIPVIVFLSRLAPTPAQVGLARDKGLLLVTCEDLDPFDPMFLKKLNDLTIPVCHPDLAVATSNAAAAALAISAGFDVGVFQAIERTEVDEVRQSYEPFALHMFEGIEQTPEYIMDLLKQVPV